jgi:hypothetical protein
MKQQLQVLNKVYGRWDWERMKRAEFTRLCTPELASYLLK